MRNLLVIFMLALSCYGQSSVNPQWFVGDWLDTNNQVDMNCSTPPNASVSGGLLNVVAEYSAGGISCGDATRAQRSVNYSTAWLLANSSTSAFAYGLVVVRAQFPGVNGTWPAAWAMQQGCQVGFHTTLNTGSGTCYTYLSAGYKEADFAQSYSTGKLTMCYVDTSAHCYSPSVTVTNMNIYAMDIEPTSVTFYLNGTLVGTYTASISNTLMFPIIAFTIGGSYAGTPNPSNFPVTATYDYYRVCPTGTTDPTPSIPTGGCSAAAATIFGDEFTGSNPASTVYVGESFTGNATAADCADSWGVLNNQQVSSINDAGLWSGNGGAAQIGPGTTINLCPVGGSISTPLVMQGSGTSGSPITVNSCGVNSTINLNGQTNILQEPCGSASSGNGAMGGNSAHN